MKTITNLKEAQSIFPDAVKLKLRIDTPTSESMVRKVIPSSVAILYCKISKNYVTLMYSEMAKEQHYPDVTTNCTVIKSGNFKLMVYSDGANVDIVTSFCPSCYPDFTRALNNSPVDMKMMANYPETEMGYFRVQMSEDITLQNDFMCSLPGLLKSCVELKESVDMVHIGSAHSVK